MDIDLKRDLTRAADLINAGDAEAAGQLLTVLGVHFPMHPYVLYNTALWQYMTGHPLAAITSYRRALGADPNLVQAQVNLGCCLMELGDLREAVRYLQMGLRRRRNDPMLYVNLSMALIGLGEATDALAAIDDALRIDANHCPSLRQRMNALFELNRFPEAREAAMLVIEHPDGRESLEALNVIVSISAKLSDWEMLERYRDKLLQAAASTTIPVTPMACAFYSDDPELLGAMAKRRCPDPRMPDRPSRPTGDERITVGYMSPDFREHPVAHMMLDLLRNHDRQAFRILTLGTLPVDHSPLAKEIASLMDGHVDLTKLDDGQAVHTIRGQGVDVLVDLTGATKWCRPGLLARRPCPAQVLWLGCPCSTGAPYYDAYILDEIVAPPGYERYCTEPILRLNTCYHPISDGLGKANPKVTREIFKLPVQGTIVGLLQQPAKIHPPFIDAVASVISRHEQAHLWVRVHDDGVAGAQRRLSSLGLPPDRQHFAKLYRSRDDYLGIFTLVDLIVDSHPYGGHSTTGEALIQGTPVLTVLGRCTHSRVAGSMLHELGLDELVFPDFASLQQGLDRLLSNPVALAEVKAKCRAAANAYRSSGQLRLPRALEEAYRSLLVSATTRAD